MVLQLCGRVCRRLSLKSLSEEIGFFVLQRYRHVGLTLALGAFL